jgi:hypothetical protein
MTGPTQTTILSPGVITTVQELIEHVLSLPPIPTLDLMAMLYAGAATEYVWVKRVPAPDYLAITREIVKGTVSNA